MSWRRCSRLGTPIVLSPSIDFKTQPTAVSTRWTCEELFISGPPKLHCCAQAGSASSAKVWTRIAAVTFVQASRQVVHSCPVCAGHVFRPSSLAKTILPGTVKGGRRLGRQKKNGNGQAGVRQVPEGSGGQRKMEETGCEVIGGAPTTPAVKG